MKEAIVIVADTHINSRLALCAPEVLDDDGNIYRQNLIQEWLWQTWNGFIKDVKKKIGKTYTTLIFNGDIVDLDAKHRTHQMVSRNPSTIINMASETLEPLVDLADRTFFVRGTEAHVGKSGWIEEMLAQRFDGVPDNEFGTYSWRHLRAEFSGVKFDIAHHVSMGGLPWTYANAAAKLVQITRYHYMDWGETPPNVVVRAHVHRHVETGTSFSTRGVILPCWQYHTGYLYRISKENDRPHIGGVVIICDKGEHEYIPFIYRAKRKPVWTKR